MVPPLIMKTEYFSCWSQQVLVIANFPPFSCICSYLLLLYIVYLGNFLHNLMKQLLLYIFLNISQQYCSFVSCNNWLDGTVMYTSVSYLLTYLSTCAYICTYLFFVFSFCFVSLPLFYSTLPLLILNAQLEIPVYQMLKTS